MKVEILQFFGWRDRSVPLPSVYQTALERFSAMEGSPGDLFKTGTLLHE